MKIKNLFDDLKQSIMTGVGRGVTKFVGNYIGDWF